MKYKFMIEDAKSKGLANESKMWQSIEYIDQAMEMIKEAHEGLYWKMMRDQHEIMYDAHYSEEFANYDVSRLSWTDNTGIHTGPYWTMQQIKDATADMRFPDGTNCWDKYVAFNTFYSDVAGDAEDGTIIKMAHHFYFADEDWTGKNKIWEYMKLVHS